MTGNSSGVSSLRELAEIARAGYAILRQPFMQVDFEVHHITDRPRYLHDLLTIAPPAGQPRLAGVGSFAETLSSSAHGIGFVTATRTGRAIAYRHQGSSAPVDVRVTGTGDGRLFRGSQTPNPTFTSESAARFEGIVCVEDEPREIQLRHGLAVKDVLREVSSTAAQESDAFLLSLQCPAQLPAHCYSEWDYSERDYTEHDVTVRHEHWPRASSIAVRFWIALQQPSTELRLRMATRLARYCAERGYGFWLADSRIGRRQGNWFLVSPHDRTRARRTLGRDADRPGTSWVQAALPVTFVGPARQDSTDSILDYLASFRELGVLACSISSLDDVAFVHLQLAANGISTNGVPDVAGELDAHQKAGAPPGEALDAAIPFLLRDEPVRAQTLGSGATGYQSLVGPLLPLRREAGCKRSPVWFSWQMEHTDKGLAPPLLGLNSALERFAHVPPGGGRARQVEATPNIDYLICRRIGDSILRAKGKLSVVEDVALNGFTESRLESARSRFCVSLEDQWRTETEESYPGKMHEMTLSWQECWLGHWR